MSPAISAASIASVPEPHIGSQNAPPGRGDLAPARHAQNGGGEVLLDGRLDLDAGLAVAALVQLGAGQVDGDDGLVGAHHDVDEQVGLDGVDVGTPAGEVGEPVGDRVFDAHRGELRVAKRVVDAGGVDRDRAVGADVVLPRHRADGLVELIGGRARDARQRDEHARGDARPQQRLVAALERPAERHARGQRPHAPNPRRAQLIAEECFGAFGAGSEEVEAVRHLARMSLAIEERTVSPITL